MSASHTLTDRLAARTSASSQASTHYFLHDNLGSIRDAYDPSSGAAAALDYTAFGEPLNAAAFAMPSGSTSFGTPSDPAAFIPCAFTGQRRDPLTSLQYHRARWYSPSLASWLSPGAEDAGPILLPPGKR